jgi:hypothetical protein
VGPTRPQSEGWLHKEFIFTRVRAHLMGHLPCTRFPDFDYRDPVLFCSQVQVNEIIGFTCRECSTGDMAHLQACLLTLRLCRHRVDILDLSTNGVAVNLRRAAGPGRVTCIGHPSHVDC